MIMTENKFRHFEPLRPERSRGENGRYEFTHGVDCVCVYDIKTLDYICEIPVGEKPDCHATSIDSRFLYIACFGGLYCISQDTLEVVRVLDTGKIYAVNAMPNGETLLVHDLCGGVLVIRDILDMRKIYIERRLQVIPGAQFRTEIGGKGHFTGDGRFYLANGWHHTRMFAFDMQRNFESELLIADDQRLYGSDDLVINNGKTKAYSACHRYKAPSYVSVTDIAKREIVKTIPTGCGTCGLTMTADERYVVASNDADDSISVIDTETDSIVNTLSARSGFEALGITGYIQGITADCDDSIFVYGCSGNGAIVRFDDIIGNGSYLISNRGEKFAGSCTLREQE